MTSFSAFLKQILSALGFFAFLSTQAQDLDPRAYMRVPIGTTTAFTGFSFSTGEVVTDPTLPVDNIKAKVESLSFGVSHTFNLLGKTTQMLVVLPYSWAQVSGDVGEQYTEITRSGMADMRFRLSTLLIGGKAGTVQEVSQAPKKTVLGLSVNVIVPTGQFYPDKLINLGTNRWSFRPELGLSQPLGARWRIDAYTGLWLFTTNSTFYPGASIRKQDPMGTFQAHFSYNIKPLLWVAINTTFYSGGASSVNDDYNDDRQNNSRIGITAVIPTGRFSSLKFAASTGAIVRVGQDFNSFTIGWQRTWLKGVSGKKQDL